MGKDGNNGNYGKDEKDGINGKDENDGINGINRNDGKGLHYTRGVASLTTACSREAELAG